MVGVSLQGGIYSEHDQTTVKNIYHPGDICSTRLSIEKKQTVEMTIKSESANCQEGGVSKKMSVQKECNFLVVVHLSQ